MSEVPPKVLFAGLFHETHGLLDTETPLADFTVTSGPQLREHSGDASPLGGALQAGQQFGWEIVPAADYRAVPGGIVQDAVLEALWNKIERCWRPDLDAIFLVLHGAMMCRSYPDVEGELLKRIRSLEGAREAPLAGVYDLHANLSPAMAEHADILIAYRENPHTDAREAAVRAATLLQRCLQQKQRPKLILRRVPIIWPPSGTGTAGDPMKSLLDTAARIEETHPGIWAVNVAPGFAYADTPWTGLSFLAVSTGDIQGIASDLDELAELAIGLEDRGRVPLTPIEDAMRLLKEEPVNGLTVLVEPSDNIGAGAPGDGTGCLRALRNHGVCKAALAINDPEAVAALARSSPGERMTLPIGGKGSRYDPGPLTLCLELVHYREDGVFELEDRQSHLASLTGDRFDMGPCAVVQCEGITILLTSKRTPPFDLGQWRSQEIDPTEFDVMVVKAAVAHRRAYEAITKREIVVDTPGACRDTWTVLASDRSRSHSSTPR